MSALAMALAALPLFAGRPPVKAAAFSSGAFPPRASSSAATRRQAKIGGHPAEEILGRLSSMTPAQLEQALSRLPPAQRANIERRIQNFQKLPPAAQRRVLDRLARLNSLPAEEQAQVRRSMRDFNALPQDRRMAINKDLRQMSKLPESERQNYMRSEDFLVRYSPDERLMVGRLAELLPPAP